MIRGRAGRLLMILAVTFSMLAMPASVLAAQTCRYVNVQVSYKIASNANLYSTTGWVLLKKYYCFENGEFTVYNTGALTGTWSASGSESP